jgi:hypothetical protein
MGADPTPGAVASVTEPRNPAPGPFPGGGGGTCGLGAVITVCDPVEADADGPAEGAGGFEKSGRRIPMMVDIESAGRPEEYGVGAGAAGPRAATLLGEEAALEAPALGGSTVSRFLQ